MLWFSNAPAAPTQFMGIHVGQEEGTYVMLLMYPDGSQETEIFEDEVALVEGAMKLHCELSVRGWRLCPEPLHEPTRES